MIFEHILFIWVKHRLSVNWYSHKWPTTTIFSWFSRGFTAYFCGGKVFFASSFSCAQPGSDALDRIRCWQLRYANMKPACIAGRFSRILGTRMLMETIHRFPKDNPGLRKEWNAFVDTTRANFNHAAKVPALTSATTVLATLLPLPQCQYWAIASGILKLALNWKCPWGLPPSKNNFLIALIIDYIILKVVETSWDNQSQWVT